jgi:hypothetical protein
MRVSQSRKWVCDQRLWVDHECYLEWLAEVQRDYLGAIAMCGRILKLEGSIGTTWLFGGISSGSSCNLGVVMVT